jgi:hypothetical protein
VFEPDGSQWARSERNELVAVSEARCDGIGK